MGYIVYIRQQDGTYSVDLDDCDGSDPDVILELGCTVALSTLTQGPYSLVYLELVNVKVVAYSLYGNSPPSLVGGLAQILMVPDAPINFGYDLF